MNMCVFVATNEEKCRAQSCVEIGTCQLGSIEMFGCVKYKDDADLVCVAMEVGGTRQGTQGTRQQLFYGSLSWTTRVSCHQNCQTH